LERYGGMAASSVRAMSIVQADKGHLLDQTVWNWMFEPDAKSGAPTDKLNGAGIEHLRYISRRLPYPDCEIFLQNAQDVPFAEGAVDKVVEARADLNMRRVQTVQGFLATQSFTPHVAYHIAIHDFAPPYMPSTNMVGTRVPPFPVTGGYLLLQGNFRGQAPPITGFGSGPAPVQQ
jgi:hypothetical protein